MNISQRSVQLNCKFYHRYILTTNSTRILSSVLSLRVMKLYSTRQTKNYYATLQTNRFKQFALDLVVCYKVIFVHYKQANTVHAMCLIYKVEMGANNLLAATEHHEMFDALRVVYILFAIRLSISLETSCLRIASPPELLGEQPSS